MRTVRPLAAALLCPALLTAATGCGSPAVPQGAAAGLPAPSPTSAAPSPASTALADQSAAEILRRTVQASAEVTSVRLAFDATVGGQHLKGTVAEDTSGTCSGTVGQGDEGTFDLIRAGGTVWIKPDAAFWESASPGSSRKYAGKYLEGATTDPHLKDLVTFCDLGLRTLQQVGGNEGGASTDPFLVKAGTRKVGSAAAVVVRDRGTTICVAAEGEPYLLETVMTGTDRGTMDFSDFGKPVTVTKPPAALVLDAAEFLRG